MAELHGRGFAAVLAADAALEVLGLMSMPHLYIAPQRATPGRTKTDISSIELMLILRISP